MAHIAFIGSGNLAGSLVRGLIERGFAASGIALADRDAAKTGALAEKHPGIVIRASNREVAADCEILIISVKPGDVRGVCEETREVLRTRSALLVSVAAGVTTEMLAGWTQPRQALVRSMPNVPVAIGCGMSALYAGPGVSPTQRDKVEQIFAAVGDVTWVEDEKLMDVVTALSGSGPAYFFRVIEALAKGAVALGMDAASAQRLAVQTAFGAASLARRGSADPKTLREMVSSRGGTTEQALASLEQSDIDTMFKRALEAAAHRSQEISRDLDEQADD